MAIAGGACQSFEMEVKDGKVIVGRYGHRQGVEMDVEKGIEKLLAGKAIFMHAYERKVAEVRMGVEKALATKPSAFAEFEAFWPAMDSLPDGADIFAGVYPVSGIPDDSQTD